MPRPTSEEFDVLLRDEGPSVWTLVVRLLGSDGHDAADCFQQAFVELVARARSRDVRAAGALLKRIAAARAIDTVRRRMRDRRRMQVASEAMLATPSGDEPRALAQTNELLDDLRAALAALPERQSAAFVLTQIENLPHDQAAVALGVTANHVGVLLHRARTALRSKLAAHQTQRETRP